jgi:hypothetical protein
VKVGSWSVLAFLCVGWLVFYVNTVTTKSSTALSPALDLFGLLGAAILLLLLLSVWRHNDSSYQRRYAQWDRSFICQRCGASTEQKMGDLRTGN